MDYFDWQVVNSSFLNILTWLQVYVTDDGFGIKKANCPYLRLLEKTLIGHQTCPLLNINAALYS